MEKFYLPIFFLAILLRVSISTWGYSGLSCPPMYGDFEAQRHWMEITFSLKIGDWYRQTSQNDLLYWGLDYPPLTAYVSYVFGWLASEIYPPLVELKTSHGHESDNGKLFMRFSVLVLDLLIYFPAAYLLSNYLNDSKNKMNLFLFGSIFSPALLLIDHGHFQYNSVCLGLALLGVWQILKNNDLIGSIFFCLSLNFKQMSLYFAPIFFSVLLRKCFQTGSFSGFLFKFISLGVTVLSSFAFLWIPFCLYPSDNETCFSSLIHVLSRQFPFSRGIFEDKVANLWYVLSVVYDFRERLPSNDSSLILRASLIATLLLLSPVCSALFSRPLSGTRFLWALMGSSLAFFLASFQVHEKSLLLMLVPASFLLPLDTPLVGWIQVLGSFSMFPLLKRDGLVIPYFAMNILYLAGSFVITSVSSSSSSPSSSNSPSKSTSSPSSSTFNSLVQKLKSLVIFLSYLGMIVLHLAEAFYPPPSRYPDLYPALFSIFGAGNLVFIYGYSVYQTWICDLEMNSSNQLKKKAE